MSGLVTRRHLPMAFVADITSPELDPADERHLTKALRLGDGDAFGVSDGAGGWVEVRFVAGSGIELAGEPVVEPAPTDHLTVGFTPVKGERAEWFVQKLTEIGVDSILPLVTERSVVRWDAAKADKLHARFLTTAREAAMQCRRLWLPTIEPLTSLSSGGLLGGATRGAKRPLADPAGRALRSDDRTLLVGPEGGWSTSEAADADLVALPGAVLRAETAAVSAGVMLAAARDGLLS